ncbi:ThuA domain-containing protein [Arenibacter sp. GZD96]|uniref:ThuA domain-containing protein n=1 Tax=Aurantibrevibacter litoralis TaxID=3106030 RepID=UPI002AFEFA6F|nr:ThuA domain-containing protein [Arenibacter sp. GZD-96]MEA1786973.1 ThuA domain-containing protein [Arenibacter sp. GZD-96]
MKKLVPILCSTICLCFFLNTLSGQGLEAFKVSKEWVTQIEQLAPITPAKDVATKKKFLIFSLHTGFEHWAIPHTEKVMSLLVDKSGMYTIDVSYNIASFTAENLEKYDAVILNNNCSIGDKRDLFWDVIKNDNTLSEREKLDKAAQLESNLLNYVAEGHGLMVLHGAIVMQNKSEKFGEMVGGSFDYHPKQQKIQVNIVDPEHPLTKAFQGEGFEHIDEPYFFNNAYFDYNFRPLLSMETKSLSGLKEGVAVKDPIKYISWIKKYGNGRVFYCSPSHNAQSYENEKLLGFLFNGMQYVAGDLLCDDSPMEK